ncbi:MAG TPA: hypothetical protein VHB25_08485 [Gemmatimonadaceae bacterium]|nr:hypothetical protein [Gemmatimonadaceae bacterium]
MPEHTQALQTWAIVEVMGHKKFAGYVTEHTIGSMALIRVGVPATQQGEGATQEYSKLIGPGSIYCITPCTEEVARAAAQRLEQWNDPIPVAMPVQRQLAAPGASDAEIVEEEFDGFDEDED